ncbi:hypothetical protein DPMN_026814 [Dreissena polymorpha]|uniref:Uncharacterized protein n=1 Tax=Dreissena polymorpha TaxID=45954 RepID=A0A9D4LU41_DREPO|nr:hypothetical protein DPMN_026814 [Dreissena polymorpha]
MGSSQDLPEITNCLRMTFPSKTNGAKKPSGSNTLFTEARICTGINGRKSSFWLINSGFAGAVIICTLYRRELSGILKKIL